jgi:tetratricopeptide (TPR) repeat protein
MRFANRTDVHVWFRGVIDLLHRLGRNEEAMVVAQYWVNRDPACGYCVAGIAGALRTAGRHKEAAQVMESLAEWRELGPAGFWNTGVAFLVSGDANKALHYFDQIDENFTGMDRDVARAYALYSLGRTEEFEEILARQLATGSTPESIARLYAWSEQPDEAFKWLELMVEEFGAAEAKGIKTDLYEPIKSDPRWQAFLEKYDAEDEPLLDIAFDPEYPPALRRAVDAAVQAR